MTLTITTSVILVLVSIVLLWFGADWLVKGASKLALSMNIKPIIIGLTVVAFGTSAPELVVSLLAAFKPGGAEMALGNVLGSNIANIALVLGICALITPLEIQKDLLKGDMPFLVLVSFLTYALARFGTIGIADETGLSMLDGVIMLGFLAYFLFRMFVKSKQDNEVDPELQELMMEKKTSNWINFVMVIMGIVFLVGGAQALVSGGEFIATSMGIPKFFISLTMFALGTSIPELAASGMAAYRKETDLCLGNVIGSNIMNLLIVLAVTVCIQPIAVKANIINFEMPAIVVVAILLYFLCRIGSMKITRAKGVLLLAFYAVFIFYSYKNGGA